MSPKFKSKRETFQIPEINSGYPENYQEVLAQTNNLVELIHQTNTIKTEEQLFKLVSDFCFQIFEIEAVVIFTPDRERKSLLSKLLQIKEKDMGKKGKIIKVFQKIPLKTDNSIASAFLTHKVSVAQKTLPSVFKKVGVKTAFALPMIVNNQCLGVLGLGYGKKVNPDKNDIRVGEMLVAHLSSSLFNIRLISSLQTQNEWTQVVQDNIREGFSLIGPDDVIYYANKMVSKLFGTVGSTVGLKREEVIKHWDKFHRYRIERFFDSDLMKRSVFESKEPFLNGLMKVYSNPPRFIEANYYPVLKNKLMIGMAASYRNVTKEKRQEQILGEQMQIYKTEKERSEAIVENVEEGICLVDGNFRIIHMNSTCEITTGLSLAEAKGEYYYKIFGCHTKSKLYFPEFLPLNKVLVTKEPLPYEEHLHTSRSGEEFWVGVSASPILDDKGQVKEIVLVIRDVSSIKELEKAKSEFVSIASHELRTPLTVVNGYLSLLRAGDLGDFSTVESRKRLSEVLEKVSNETTRLTQLVSDLLNVSRIEENRITLNKRSENINNVILNVIDEMSPSANEKRIKILYTKDTTTELTASFDFDKISQVLINLIDNSMKFTQGGGKIKIESWREDNKVFVGVEDNGIGIPTKLMSIIFEKFQQVPGSYLKENRGTGLGLFIVKSLVELHDGEVNIESSIGSGTKITFSLPV